MTMLYLHRLPMLLVLIVLVFTDPSFARHVEIRQAQAATPTDAPAQASVNNALCATPIPLSETAADAALDRGVPFFLNDVLTLDFLPNNGNNMTGWFQYVWTKVFPSPENNNVAPEGCLTMKGTCPVYGACGEAMELFWTQNTVTQFYNYLNTFNNALEEATLGVLASVDDVSTDFPPQVPVVSEATFLNNFGAALSILGGGVGLFGGENPAAALGGGFLGMIGSVFSDVGSQLQASISEEQADLKSRLRSVFFQSTNNTGFLLTAVVGNGDLSAYPGRVVSGSQYNNSLVAFFDNGNFFLPNTDFTEQALVPVLSDQLLMTLTGAAVLEANYYVLKDSYTVPDCPTGPGLTGAVIDNSCYTLEKAGEGLGGTLQSIDSPPTSPSTFSTQMNNSTVTKLVDTYKVSLSDLYTSSYACQNASNAYGTTLDFSNLDLNITAIPPCFYNLPVLQVTPDPEGSDASATGATPCAIFEANSTASKPQVGLTFLPNNLSSIFTKGFCEYIGYAPIGHDILGRVAGSLELLLAREHN